MNMNPQAQHFGYKGSEEAMPKPQADEGGPTTLLVRHLPEAIPHKTLSHLFSHYGASSVRPCAGGRLRNCAFVDFKDETLASQAESQLNRLRFLGKVLSVERASKQILNNKNQKNEVQPGKDLNSLPTSWQKDLSRSLDGGANADSSSIGEPIAKRLGVDYPFPPHLEYAYPPPDGNILTNIVNALIAVPRFYTQVLHLMNKMNIPAPFRMALTTPPLPPSVAAAPPPPPPPQPSPIVALRHVADLSSDESELESSEEGGDDINSFAIKDSRILMHRRKRARREVILGPAIDKEVAHEAVGLKPSTLVPKEIPTIKKNSSVLKIRIAPKLAHEPKHDYENREPIEQAKEDSAHKPYALPEEIESGKLPPEEILSLPMFKNYSAGNPACVLYIKNLAKDLVPEDFYFIFGSLFGGVEAAKSALNVKLMQEGRMRGQAFVTFPTVDLAHHALILVNGYVFKGKPMIIQFGRNAGAGKAN